MNITKRDGLSFSEAGRLGFLKSQKKLTEQKAERVRKYFLSPKACLFCSTVLVYEERHKKFCGSSCSANYSNATRKVQIPCEECQKPIFGDSRRKFCSKKCQQKWQSARLVKRWQKGLEKGWSGLGYSISSYIRNYLFKKFDSRCQECGWSKPNPITHKIPLQIDHVDGNAANCTEGNLKLLCPNCHALTPTFGRLNKTTCRKHRWPINHR